MYRTIKRVVDLRTGLEHPKRDARGRFMASKASAAFIALLGDLTLTSVYIETHGSPPEPHELVPGHYTPDFRGLTTDRLPRRP